MKLLVLGGTRFVGRHISAAALANGHELTVFHRGQMGRELFPEAEHLLGDRDGELDSLRGRRWDAVIDVNGYVPRIVRQSAELLKEATPHYVFISTISVYAGMSVPDQDEDAPLGTLADPSCEEITGESYGPLKVLCERVVQKAFPRRALIIRPSVVVGPHDPSDRFTYWVHRAAQGGEMLVPGDPRQRMQFIDGRDLGEWAIRMAEARGDGTFNAAVNDPNLTMGSLIDLCIKAANVQTKPVWCDEAFVLAQGLEPWTDLPLWLPTQTTAEYRGFNSVSSTRAVQAGLTFRPLSVTIADTLEWIRRCAISGPLQAGLVREREQEVLHKWANRTC